MAYKYFPVLLAKAGELTALSRLEHNVKEEISPIIQVLSKNDFDSVYDALLKCFTTHWSFSRNQILFDFSLVDKFSLKEIFKLLSGLKKGGVNAVPVVGSNASEDFITMATRYANDFDSKLCVRFREENEGLRNFTGNLKELIERLYVPLKDVILWIDMGYINSTLCSVHTTLLESLIQNIPNKSKYAAIVISSGSFPMDLGGMEVQDEPHLLTRYEWRLWQALKGMDGVGDVITYSDYTTKNPNYKDLDGFSGTCSVKYTGKDDFVIYRGDFSTEHELESGQYIMHSRRLIKSRYYQGENFCWGNHRIKEIGDQDIEAKKIKPGSARTWVEISRNHHITLMHQIA